VQTLPLFFVSVADRGFRDGALAREEALGDPCPVFREEKPKARKVEQRREVRGETKYT
jgi:hypothetical protein